MATPIELSTQHQNKHIPVVGSGQFELAYLTGILPYRFHRSNIWRGFMPAEARFRYHKTFSAQENKFGLIKVDQYQSTIHPDQEFLYVYQAIEGRSDTLLTYIISAHQGPIIQKQDQIARYGSYHPKAYQVEDNTPLPVLDGYRAGTPILTIAQIKQIIPQIAELLQTESGILYMINRLATYLYDKTIDLGVVNGQFLKAKIFLNFGNPQKYVAEVMPVDEQGGIIGFVNRRFEETNDNWYAISHHLIGPYVPTLIIPPNPSLLARINPTDYSHLSIVSGPKDIWIVGHLKNMPYGTLHFFDSVTKRQGDTCDFLFRMPVHSNNDEIVSAIKQFGLGHLLV